VRVGQAADLAVTDVVALCQPHPHAELAAEYLAAGTSVVSVSADVSDVRDLIDLDAHAKHHNAALIVGAAMSPGLTALLADLLWRQLHVAEEIHVATHGTAGPACAVQHHNALGETAIGWHDGAWIERPAAAVASSTGFRSPSGHATATGPRCPIRYCCIGCFPASPGSAHACRAPVATVSPPACPMLTPPHAAG
jgi:hypothetical protein